MNNENPITHPESALRILSWFCPRDMYEEIEGDLIQNYYEDARLLGAKKARQRMIWSAIRFCRPGILLRNSFSLQINKIDVLIHHLRLAIRIFLKDKFFSTLNVLGLSLGIAVSIVLFLILQYDLKYDQHYPNHERIYRLGAHVKAEGIDERTARSNRLLGEVLKEELPEVESVTRINILNRQGGLPVTTEVNGKELMFDEPSVFRTDSNYFKVFQHEFIAGDMNTCFKKPDEVVITASMAKRIFGDVEALGRTVRIGYYKQADKIWTISGVIKDFPENTHLKFNIIESGLEINDPPFHPNVDSINSEAFWDTQVYLYVLMSPAYTSDDFLNKWQAIDAKYFKPYGDKMAATYTPILQPLDDIHFHSDLQQDQPVGNMIYLYAFIGIGIFIVLLACINYMNLSTAKSSRRAPEIGMKKALGSGKQSLIISFLGESVLLSLISLMIAIVIVVLVLDTSSFNALVDRTLTFSLLSWPQLIMGVITITLGIGILSGLYPSLYLPAIPTISALKGTYRSGNSSHAFRKVLITVQFVISMLVIVCTIFMHNQLDFMRNKDMGYKKENIIVVKVMPTIQDHMPAIKDQFLNNPRIKSVGLSRSVLGWSSSFISGRDVLLTDSKEGVRQNTFNILEIDEDYFKTMNIQLIKGREFKPGLENDREGVFIVNQTASKLMGWSDDPIGKSLRTSKGEAIGEVVGLVKDFNYSSLHNAIEPLLLIKMPFVRGYVHIKVAGDHLPETIEHIRKTLTSFSSKFPFEYFFFDDRFNEQYQADDKQYKLISALSYVCIFISLLGLLGLAAFTATQRTKEIGIRKILGANVTKIIILLSKDVLILVLVSSLLVIPLSYWAIHEWLQNFAYQVSLDYLIYFLVTIVALFFVFLTILLQSYKTARSNPVDALKYE